MRLLPLVLVCACSGDRKAPPGGDADSDVDTDADSDGDTDGDTDTGGGDADWDAGPADAGYEDCLGRCTGGLACCENAFGTGVRGCTDPQFDVLNCGGCAIACRDDEICGSGLCGCPAGECGDRCVDLTWDAANCGFCGNVCGGATPICFLGSCRSCGGTGGAPCGGECPRVLEDESNCGACGNECLDSEQCAAGVCAGSDCDADCGLDGACCDNPWGGADEGCTNVEWDDANCGACGNPCADGSRCVRGACIAQDCDDRCDFGQVCCDNVWGGGAGCTSVEWDTGNCGVCGVTCDAGDVCAEGDCRSP